MLKLHGILFGSKKIQSPRYGHPGSSKLVYIMLLLFVIAIPAVCTYSLVTFYLDAQLLKFTPQWSDEIFHWHQVATFLSAGFNGGYYTVNEQPAVASFTHFYAHGPFYPLLMGSIGFFTGWEINSAPLFNITSLTLAIIFFICYIKPNKLQLVLIGLVMLTCWPVHLYMATNMRLVLFSSFAIVIAAFFSRTLTKPDSVSYRHLTMFFITIIILTLLKVSNAILFIPYLLLIRKRICLSVLQAVIAALVLIIVFSYVVSYKTGAPFPNPTINLITAVSHSFVGGLREVILNALFNTLRFFHINQHKLWLLLRAQLLVTIIAGCWFLWRERKDRVAIQESILVLTYSVLTLVAVIFLTVMLTWRDFRVFAPIVLMITLIFVARQRMLPVVFILIGNLLLLPCFLETYSENMSGAFPETRISTEEFTDKIMPVIKYDRNRDGWYNTLLVPMPIAFHRHMLGVPAGIGISFFTSLDKLSEIKSRYLLLDKSNYEILKNRVSLDFKLTTTIGDLYINRDTEFEK